MKIKKISLKNFRGYKSLELKFDDKFNLIIGDNGSGKTALLEAITVAIGSFLLGIRNINSRGIHREDIHIATFEEHEEYSFPVIVEAEGIVSGKKISWKRELNGIKNRTTTSKAKEIINIAKALDKNVRNGENVNLPVLIYYATGRLFDVARVKEKKNNQTVQIASKFRAYERCMDAKSTHRQFQKWFRGKEISKIQKQKEDISYSIVKEAIIKNLPYCKNIFYEFDPDKPQGLKIELNDGRVLPFNALSDGMRNFFAIVSDVAYKSVTLNPHLKNEVLIKTSGVVIIDELDLHLHPEWQRKIINILQETFPNIQFITTTHSPFLIQETGREQLIVLKDNNIDKITSGNNLSIEDIAEQIQYVSIPQWSSKRREMFELASKYYKALKEGKNVYELKQKLDDVMKLFSVDTAFYSIIEQEKIIQEHKKDKK